MNSRPVVIVTGGTRGIGRSTVRRLCAAGFGVVFTHSDSDADAETLEADLGRSGALVRGVRLDVTEEDAPERLFELAGSVGEVAGLVNNAGVTGRIGPFTGLTDADPRRVVEVNLVAPVRLCRSTPRSTPAPGSRDGRSGWRPASRWGVPAGRRRSPRRSPGCCPAGRRTSPAPCSTSTAGSSAVTANFHRVQL